LAHKRTNDVKQQSANTQQAVPDTILINKIELKEFLSEIIGNTEFPMSVQHFIFFNIYIYNI
jgi:hypothetical protein